MPAVSAKGVSKKYRIFPSRQDRLKEVLSFGRKEYGHDFWALRDVNLEVEAGTTLGILGRNGAGKSTLLNIIAGILQPTSGTVEVRGRVVALSGLGTGFNPEFTGRENAMLNGLLLGIERKEMLERFDDITAFADVGEFMDQPIKTYSSGMRSRLGFAVAINVKPDILILDETLATGDAVYRQMAMQKMYELRDSGTTILFVSHSTSSVEDFCTEALLLHEGRVMATGETTQVIGEYDALVAEIKANKRRQQMDDGQPSDRAEVSGVNTSGDTIFKRESSFEHLHSGTGEARIQSVELLDEFDQPIEVVAPGATVTVRVYLECLEAVSDCELRISIHNEGRSGQAKREPESPLYEPILGYVLELYERYRKDPRSVDERAREFFEGWSPPQVEANGHGPGAAGTRTQLFSASTALEGVLLKEMDKGERVIVDFTFKIPLRKGHYGISVGARASDADSFLDWVDIVRTFRVKPPPNYRRPFLGLLHVPTRIKVHTREGERQGRPV